MTDRKSDSDSTFGLNNGMDTDNDADPNSISIEKAQRIIASTVPRVSETEELSIERALGRVLSEDMLAPIDVPSFRASAMDGYAFRFAERENALRISENSLAGHPSNDSANANECHRITTGARVPDFADTVVQQENVVLNDKLITITKQPPMGHHVRAIGSNSEKGTLLMQKGQRLGAAQIASLCAQGIQSVPVLRKIQVAMFSTGDELVNGGRVLSPGNIYDANRALLSSLLDSPGIEVIDVGIVDDSVDALQNAMQQCANADIVLSSGGVSVGDADFVRPVLEQLGQLHIWKIAIKPGRPLTFGMLGKQQPYFGLPGNPVSAAITCLFFVKPAIKAMLGEPINTMPRVHATLQTSLKKLPGRVEYQRGILKMSEAGEWQVSTTGMQDSHVVTSLHRANCFIELAFDSTGFEEGDQVTIIPFSHFSDNLL